MCIPIKTINPVEMLFRNPKHPIPPDAAVFWLCYWCAKIHKIVGSVQRNELFYIETSCYFFDDVVIKFFLVFWIDKLNRVFNIVFEYGFQIVDVAIRIDS